MNQLLAVICLFLILQLVYPFLTVLLAQLRKTPSLPPPLHPRQIDFACIITAYRNAEIAQPLVTSILQQTHQQFMIYLVADECPDLSISFQDDRLVILRPKEPLRLKVKSLAYAFQKFQRRPDYVVVFDADNLAHPQFLEEIGILIQAGFRCIQGQRSAKNLDTSYAALDSLGEHYKNYIEREVPYRLGGSAVISGSGMATETTLYQNYLESPAIKEGSSKGKKMLQEDKILQNFLLLKGERIAYARHAIVYDEKVATAKAIETQRSRWLFSYFQNLPNALKICWRGVYGLNMPQVYFGFVTMVLPMFIQLGLALVVMTLSFFFAPYWSLALGAAITLFSFNLLWVLYLDDAPGEVWRAIWQVPRFILRQMTGLFKMHNPNKHFTSTEHNKVVSIQEILNQKRESEKNP